MLKGKNMWKGKESLQNIMVWLIPSLFVFFLAFSFIYLSYLDKDFYKLFILTFLAAGLGAGIPAWLVWYLTINREEKKRQKDEKNALLIEYTKASKNLSNSKLLYDLSKNIDSETAFRSLHFFNMNKYNLQALSSVNNFYPRSEEGSLGCSIFIRISYCDDISTKLASYMPDIDDSIASSHIENYKTMWKMVHNLSAILVYTNYWILESIANYIDLKYNENYIKDLEKLDTYKSSRLIAQEYEKKLNKNKKQENNDINKENDNVPTEKLSK